ncbi:hypothetical protein [Pseudonocardia acidicola]|uniref:Uncharacterized protein n=1 Tax=Pseudonocardia acidicola TaxID=2724939 RepID=A0ABX1SEJ5_9PSEU|nr:hypothetical protein [Pseudonocardia acidicola]NMH99302.1 hypothetical protein [Pseudonocardia acidicola]
MRRTRLFVALGLVLFGITFLWFTPAFAGTPAPPVGPAWVVIRVLAPVTVLVFAAAGWAVYRALTWWRAVAIIGSILAAALMLVWWIAVSGVPGVPNVLTNLGLHWAGAMAVLVLALLAPGADRPLGAGRCAPPGPGPDR